MKGLKGKKLFLLGTVFWMGLVSASLISFSVAGAPESQAPKLHGKALKEKMASLEIFQETPARAHTRLGPLWASKSTMEKTMKNLRKQAAKMGADAIINLRVRTEKLRSVSYDPGWWGPIGYRGGVGPYGGWWGGFNYWSGYAQTRTYMQPVVTGWAVKWD